MQAWTSSADADTSGSGGSPTSATKRAKRAAEAPVNVGVVSHVRSLSEFEAAARRGAAKGVIVDRGPHALEAEMARWVAGQEEPMESFAFEEVEHPSPGDVLDACQRLTAGLPEALRDALRSDAEELSTTLLTLCPAASCLTLHVDIIGVNACQRWHEDNYIGRTVVTYSGPGTWMVDDASVRYDQFAATQGEPTHVSDPRIVPSFESIHCAPANAIALIKGKQWPGIAGSGLIHKSPNVEFKNGRPTLKRLLLKVDLSNKCSH